MGCYEWNPTDVDEEEIPTPAIGLTNYPNPFNPVTTINFSLTEPEPVKLEVFNIRGQLVTTLVDERLAAGGHNVVWQAEGLASGVYFARLEAGGVDSVRKLLLVK